MIGGAAGKRARTSEPISEGRAAKRAWAAGSAKTTAPSSTDKWKGVVGLLSSAPDNEFLNAAEETLDSTPASAAKELCDKMFGGPPDASDPCLLALVSHLACSTRQQAAFSTRSVDDLGDSLREMLFMVSHMFSSGEYLYLP